MCAWVYVCMGMCVWAYACMGVCVHRCMGAYVHGVCVHGWMCTWMNCAMCCWVNVHG